MASLELSVSNHRSGDLRRRSRRAMRPWRSPAARMRWEEEGSVERRSRRRGEGVQRSAVTNGERELLVEEEVGEGGGGMGRAERSCMERVSTTEMELPEGKARRPCGPRSADPKLLRLGGPGSMESHDEPECEWEGE